MRFVCDSCKAKYSISDEKVRGKILKIRCKKCNHIIEVRDPSARPSQQAAPGQSSLPAGPTPSPRHSDLLSSFGAQPYRPAEPLRETFPPQSAFDSLVPEEEEEEEEEEGGREGGEHTMISAPGLLDELRHAAAGLVSQPAVEPALTDWFVAIDDEPTGPVTKEQIRGYVTTGKVNSESLAWREGFDDWRPLRECAELKDLLRTSRAFFNITAPPQRRSHMPSQPYAPPPPPAPKPIPSPRPGHRPAPRAATRPISTPAPIAPPRQPEALRGQRVGQLGTVPPQPQPQPQWPGGLVPIPASSPAPPLPTTPAFIPEPPPARSALTAQPAAAIPAPPSSPFAGLGIGSPLIPPPPVPLAAPPPPAPAATIPAAPIPPPPAPPARELAAQEVKPTAEDSGALAAFVLAAPREAPLPSTPPVELHEIEKVTKPRRQMFFVIASAAAIAVGVAAAILLIRFGNPPEAATNATVASPTPIKAAVPIGSGSLVLPMGGGASEEPPPVEQPDAAIESAPPAPTPQPRSAPQQPSSQPAGAQSSPPTSTKTSSTLTPEQRRIIEQAKSLGEPTQTPTKRPAEAEGSGGSASRGQPLSSEDIRSTVNRNQTSIQRCYEREMRGASGSGDLRVELQITVQPSGVVSAVQVSPANVRGTQLANCMVSAARRWRFPEATAPSTFEAPFVLSPGRGR